MAYGDDYDGTTLPVFVENPLMARRSRPFFMPGMVSENPLSVVASKNPLLTAEIIKDMAALAVLRQNSAGLSEAACAWMHTRKGERNFAAEFDEAFCSGGLSSLLGIPKVRIRTTLRIKTW